MSLAPSPTDPDLTAAAVERLAYSVDETYTMLGIGRTAFYEQLVNTGRLRTITVGGRRLVPRAALEAFLAGDAGGGDAP